MVESSISGAESLRTRGTAYPIRTYILEQMIWVRVRWLDRKPCSAYQEKAINLPDRRLSRIESDTQYEEMEERK